jgi:hypothetical protein
MNGKRAKAIRNLAIDNAPDDAGMRELVLARRGNRDVVINHPNSVRTMEKALKKAYKKAKG